MSTRTRKSKKQSSARDTIVNVRDKTDENTAASRKQSTSKKTKNDAISDDITNNAARLLGKLSRGKVNKEDMTADRETTENNKKKRNDLMTTQKHMNNEENGDEDDEDEQDESEDENEDNNDDNLSNSGFSNASYDERRHCVEYDEQNNNERQDETDFMERNTSVEKPSY